MKIHRSRQPLLKALALLVLLLTATRGVPYAVQTHEQLIDLAWNQSIRPLLLKRFPTLTEAQIREAHAYAYGGCAIQDFGYYPQRANAQRTRLRHRLPLALHRRHHRT